MKGKLLLIGFGPGADCHLTFRARDAIAESQVVIGYSTYIKLIEDLLEGIEVHRKGMSEELDRVHLAYDLARAGKIVARNERSRVDPMTSRKSVGASFIGR